MQPIAVIHEDNGHKDLVTSLIEHLNSVENLQLDSNLVAFSSVGSKSNFFKLDEQAYRILLPRIKAGVVRKVLFIVDADYVKDNIRYGGIQNTKDELNKITTELGIQDIAQIYVLHNPNSEEGLLESMLLATLPVAQRNCIECFINCSKIKPKNFYKTIIKNLHKTAYPDESYYNFGHPHFNELKQKLINLF